MNKLIVILSLLVSMTSLAQGGDIGPDVITPEGIKGLDLSSKVVCVIESKSVKKGIDNHLICDGMLMAVVSVAESDGTFFIPKSSATMAEIIKHGFELKLIVKNQIILTR